MIGLDMFNVANNVAQRVLSQSNNISYAARGASRMNSIPDDRQADYLFRDFYMVIVIAYLTELAFRTTEGMLTIPKFTEAIGFNKLEKLYGKGAEAGLHGYFPQARNYKNIPEIIRPRVLGSLVKDKSNDLIPKLLRDLDIPKLRGKLADLEKKGASPKKIEAMRAQVAESELLAHHFRRFFDFKGYVTENLVKMGTVSPKEAEKFSELLGNFSSELDDSLREYQLIKGERSLKPGEGEALLAKYRAKARKALEKAAKKSGESVVNGAVEQQAQTAFETELRERGARVLGKTGLEEKAAELQEKYFQKGKVPAKIRTLLEEALSTSRTRTALKAIQKNSIWPKMAVSVLVSFLFYGLMGNNFDTKILQPWQDKLVKERGSSREVVPPFYKALLPGAATLGVLMSNKTAPFMRRMGYLGRFAVAGAAALGVYTTAALLGVKRALAKPPETPPVVLGDENPALAGVASGPQQVAQLGGLNYKPMGFQLFEMARQMNSGSGNPFGG